MSTNGTQPGWWLEDGNPSRGRRDSLPAAPRSSIAEQAARLRFASQLARAVEPSIAAARRLEAELRPALAVARKSSAAVARLSDYFGGAR